MVWDFLQSSSFPPSVSPSFPSPHHLPFPYSLLQKDGGEDRGKGDGGEKGSLFPNYTPLSLPPSLSPFPSLILSSVSFSLPPSLLPWLPPSFSYSLSTSLPSLPYLSPPSSFSFFLFLRLLILFTIPQPYLLLPWVNILAKNAYFFPQPSNSRKPISSPFFTAIIQKISDKFL